METKQTDGKVFSEQLDMFDLIKIASDLGNSFSSDDIEQVIERLQSVKRAAKKREEDESKRKMAEERARREREEAEQREAHIRDVTSMDLPMEWDNVFNSDERAREVHADSIPDALILSLSNLGRVDVEYISAITGSDYKTVICALKGSIYQNPNTWGECFLRDGRQRRNTSPAIS